MTSLLIKLLPQLHLRFTFPCCVWGLTLHPLILLLIFYSRSLFLQRIFIWVSGRPVTTYRADYSFCMRVSFGNPTPHAHPESTERLDIKQAYTKPSYIRKYNYVLFIHWSIWKHIAHLIRSTRIEQWYSVEDSWEKDLNSSAASSALGLPTVATRFPPAVLTAEPLDWPWGILLPVSLLTRSWIPTNWALDSTTAPVKNTKYILEKGQTKMKQLGVSGQIWKAARDATPETILHLKNHQVSIIETAKFSFFYPTSAMEPHA